jgi:ParB/RepB/Spo0J family partition protein
VAGKKDFATMEARGSSGDSAARAALRSRIANPSSIRLDELQPNPHNPRYAGDDPEIEEMAETMGRVGQLQPALVVSVEQYLRAYPDLRGELGPQPWVVIVGNRRLAAARLAGRRALDVRVDSELETAEDVEDRVLIENIQRKDLPPLLEAAHLQGRLGRPGETVRSVGAAVGKSHAYVQQRLDLLRMIPDFQELFRSGEINIRTGRQLGTQPEDVQRAILSAGPPFSLGRPRPAEEPTGEPEPVNQVPTADAPEAVNPVSTAAEEPAGEPDDVNPVSTTGGDRAEVGAPPAPAEPSPISALPASAAAASEVAPTPGAGADTTAVSPRNGSVPFHRFPDIEATRISVSQWLDNALAELDRVLPASGGGAAGQALADARCCVNDARAALDRVPHPAGD